MGIQQLLENTELQVALGTAIAVLLSQLGFDKTRNFFSDPVARQRALRAKAWRKWMDAGHYLMHEDGISREQASVWTIGDIEKHISAYQWPKKTGDQ